MNTNGAAERPALDVLSRLTEAVSDFDYGEGPKHRAAMRRAMGEAQRFLMARAALAEGVRQLERQLQDKHAHERNAGAAPLDMERLAQADTNHVIHHRRNNPSHANLCDEWIAAEYVRLSEGTDR